MASLDRQITSTADDGHFWSEWISDDAFNNVLVGEPFGEPAHGAFRFPNITVPKDAIITAAYITLETAQEQGLTTGSIVSIIRGIAEDNFAQATSDATWTADHAAHTSASVNWNFATNSTPGTSFQTPSIVSIIQELVNRSGWVSGNAIGIHIDDNGTTGDSCQAFADPDDAGGNEAAILHIEYTEPSSFTLEQEGFRWRNDDGDEDDATWIDAQDTDIDAAPLQTLRLRIISDVTGDPPSQALKLQYRRDDEGDTEWIDV